MEPARSTVRTRWQTLVFGCGLAMAVSILLAAPDARAQVNTENLRKRIKVVGYSLIVEGTLTSDTGNTTGVSVGAGLGGGWAGGPHLAFAYARVDYTKYNGATSVDKSFAHARYNYEFEKWLWGEFFVQAQSDAFQRLDLRNLVGVGPRVRVLHGLLPKDFDVFLGTAYMLERDAITPVAGSTGYTNQTVQIWHRWSNYGTVQWEIDERAILATTFYVQPAFDDFGDVRLLSETLLTFKISKYFSSSIAATVRYDSEPPTAVLPIDSEVKSILAVTF
jgi:putative salt-induced outer membrane protein YdiY